MLRGSEKFKKLRIRHVLIFTSIIILTWLSCDILKPVVDVIKVTDFSTSAHADRGAKSFVFWDKNNPPEVPVMCARCHSIHGFLDFAVDGVVNKPAAPGVFTCQLCHTNEKKGTLRFFATVTFPSGVVVSDLGNESICIQCHQGIACADTVNKAADGLPDDSPNAVLCFVNIHSASAAVVYGGLVRGGYQYIGKTYQTRCVHIESYNSCTGCHDPHTLKIKTKHCRSCHTDVKGQKDLKNIRGQGFPVDYDSDGNISEGIYYEVQGVWEKLYAAVRDYANRIVHVPIGYNENTSPYLFKDINKDGVIDVSEAVSGNCYNAFTPRLLRACYNMQLVKKDPGGFAHGSKYLIELMYHSIQDLSTVL
ncbi:MAG: polyheme membrane-associated cytochrome C [Acidobacteria bacterium]|jgi:hypothetical protein|nr:polyheme membrane-associated cytochrome C [Acidobacteriota bacterium]